jgi:microcystin degradation protein MlrC
LNIRVEHGNRCAILDCEDRLVLGHETGLLCSVMRQAYHEIVVNLREVTPVHAAGAGALISLQAAGFYLTLADPISLVREILAPTELDSIFEITETRYLGTRRFEFDCRACCLTLGEA